MVDAHARSLSYRMWLQLAVQQQGKNTVDITMLVVLII